jgi:hypothetical protein
MVEDLARSGLTVEDIHSSIHPWHSKGVDAAYLIPYSDMDGRFLNTESGESYMYRLRLKLNRFADPKKQGKYTGPSREQVGDLCNIPYIPPGGCGDGDVLYVCEGEKKALAVRKAFDVAVLGIGGCWNWRHEWVFELCKRYEKVVIIPDGDVHRYDIAKAYGTFAQAVDGILLDPPDKIDDMIVEGLTEEEFLNLDVLREYVESPDSLVETYGLTYDTVRKAKKIYANESNIGMLLKKHPIFPEIWRNTDNNEVVFGEHDDTDEHVVLRLLQHNLGMPNARMHIVRDMVGWIADQRKRSPYMEWLDGLEWDGVPRMVSLFVKYCGAPDTPFNRELAWKWMISSVMRQVDPGAQCDFVVIAHGAQGIGKSRFVHTLFGEWAVDIIGTETQHKDLLQKMHMGKCVVFEEMASMNGKELEHLKALVTSREDFFRQPYARETERMKRQFVMYATTNREQFIKGDPSGYRRWGVVEFKEVDIEGLERDREQIWAEAYSYVKNGWSGGEYDISQHGWIEVPASVVSEHVAENNVIETFKECWEEGRFGHLIVEGSVVATLRELCISMEIPYSTRPSFEVKDLREWLKQDPESPMKYYADKVVAGRRRQKVFVSTETPTVTAVTTVKF